MNSELDTRLLALVFGNEEALLAKEAGALDVAGQAAAAAILLSMLDSQKDPAAAAKAKHQIRPVIQSLERHEVRNTYNHDFRRGPRLFVQAAPPSGPDPIPEDLYKMRYQMGFVPGVPAGMDEGMIRLASASQRILEASGHTKEAFVGQAVRNMAHFGSGWARGAIGSFRSGMREARESGAGLMKRLRWGIGETIANTPRAPNAFGVHTPGGPGVMETFKSNYQGQRDAGFGRLRSVVNASNQTGQQLKNVRAQSQAEKALSTPIPEPTPPPPPSSTPATTTPAPTPAPAQAAPPQVPAAQPAKGPGLWTRFKGWVRRKPAEGAVAQNTAEGSTAPAAHPNQTTAESPKQNTAEGKDGKKKDSKSTSWVPGAIGLGLGAGAAIGIPKVMGTVLDYGEKEQAPTPWGMQPYGSTRLHHNLNQYGQPMP